MEKFELPQRFEEYSEGRKAGFMKMKALKEEGRRVAGYFCTFTPLEVLDAAGLVSVGLCGMSNETVEAAEADLPKNLCPLIKSSYGFAITEKCPYTYWSDLIIGETTCDGKKKMYELLSHKKETYILQIPQGVNEEYARKLWIKELHAYIDFIADKFGVEITDEKLRRAAEKRNEFRRACSELMELQRAVPAPVSGEQLYKFLDGLKFDFDLDHAIASIHKLTGELKEVTAGSAAFAGAKRILVTGCPIGGVLEKVVGSVERNGGQVVCFENCSGIKATRCYVDTDAEDIVAAIADAYLNIGCAVMTPNDRRKQNIVSLIKEFGAEAVLDVTLQACNTYMIETDAMRKICGDMGIPYMSLETDYSKTDSGQIDTRIAAFIEML